MRLQKEADVKKGGNFSKNGSKYVIFSSDSCQFLKNHQFKIKHQEKKSTHFEIEHLEYPVVRGDYFDEMQKSKSNHNRIKSIFIIIFKYHWTVQAIDVFVQEIVD